MSTWIDVHHHFLTPRYVEELARIGMTQAGGRPFPSWTFQDSIDAMDRRGIDAALLSLGPPGPYTGRFFRPPFSLCPCPGGGPPGVCAV
jgi:hypothetical protein